MSRRWPLAVVTVLVFVLPAFGWRFSTSPPLVAMTPAIAYTPSAEPPQLFPPPGSRVPANTELRVDHGLSYAKLTARTDAMKPVALNERAIGAWNLAARPVTPPKAGTRVTIALEARGDGGAPFGAGVLGTLTWTDREDVTPPVLTLVGGVTRTDAIGQLGRLAGFPDYLDVGLHVEDESPVAMLAQIGVDVPNADAKTTFWVPKVASDRVTSMRVAFGGPSAGVRIAVQALDAAGNTSGWSTTGFIPAARDELTRFPPDAGAAPPAPSTPPPRSGCSR